MLCSCARKLRAEDTHNATCHLHTTAGRGASTHCLGSSLKNTEYSIEYSVHVFWACEKINHKTVPRCFLSDRSQLSTLLRHTNRCSLPGRSHLSTLPRHQQRTRFSASALTASKPPPSPPFSPLVHIPVGADRQSTQQSSIGVI